jgi:hypothetical protein
MDSPTKPWYFSSKAIIRVAKKAIAALPANLTEFEQCLFGVATLTKLIQNKTDSGTLVINLEEAPGLIDQLGQLSADQYVARNDGLDQLRTSVTNMLRNLIARISEQQKLASDYLCQRSVEAQQFEEQLELASPPSASTWLSATFLTPALITIQKHFPAQHARGTALVNAGKCWVKPWLPRWDVNMQRTEVSVAAIPSSLLSRAQLYAVRAVPLVAPLVVGVVHRVQPYATVLQPVAYPVLLGLKSVQEQLSRHSSIGQYVRRAVGHAEALWQLFKLHGLSAVPELDLLPIEVPDLELPVDAPAIQPSTCTMKPALAPVEDNTSGTAGVECTNPSLPVSVGRPPLPCTPAPTMDPPAAPPPSPATPLSAEVQVSQRNRALER